MNDVIFLNCNSIGEGGGGKIHHATQNLIRSTRVRTIITLVKHTALLHTFMTITITNIKKYF